MDGMGGGPGEPEVPRLFAWVMAMACPAEDRLYVLADLEQELGERWRAGGRGSAVRWYRAQVLRSVVPCLRRRLRSTLRGLKGGWFSDFLGDGRYAGRRLIGTPVQTVVTAVSLGIGIGVTTSVFAVGNAFLFQSPGGLENTDGLVALYTSDVGGDLYQPTSFPDYQDVARDTEVFEGLTALRPGIARWSEGEVSRRTIVEIVTGNYFDVLGVRMSLGRGFRSEETVLGRAEQVVVLAHHIWKERFASDPGVLGRSVRLNGRDFTVIGVAPEGLIGRFLRLKVDAWVPLGLPGGFYHATPDELITRGDREYLVYGRLRPGLTLEHAQARLAVIADRLREEHGADWEDDRGRGRTFTLLAEKDSRIPPSGKAALTGVFGLLLAAGAAVLLIACTNVAGLFLARATRRRREIAVRLSLGAGRLRVVRLLFVEALLVALAGGGLGLWLAGLSARFLAAIPFPIDVPLAFDVDLDGRVLAFALLVSVGAALAFGLLPALRAARPQLVTALRDEAGIRGRWRGVGLRGGLVVAQVAASVALLVGAGLALRTAGAADRFQRVLDPRGIALVSHTIRDQGLGEADIRQRVLELAERVAAHPEVSRVAVASVPELSPFVGGARGKVTIEGYEPPEGQDIVLSFNAVTPGYFDMVDLHPVRGRTLGPDDREGAPSVALVNETFVERYWPGSVGLGRRFSVIEKRTFDSPYPSSRRSFEVVGVLPDVLATPAQSPEPFFWTSYLQDATRLAVIHAEARFDVDDVLPILRREVVANDDDIQLVPPRPYEDLIAFMLLPQRIASQAFAWAGLFALLLAVMGIYGIVSFAVSERTREMAIRVAVGAARRQVLRVLLMHGMRLAGAGILLGLVVAVMGAYLARSTLMGVSPLDPAALAGGVAVLLGAAFLATWVPARRATRVDPMWILREE